MQLDEREVQLQLLIQLQTEYQLSQQDVTRRMDEAQNQMDKVKPGGTVSELEAQLNQLQVNFKFFSMGKEEKHWVTVGVSTKTPQNEEKQRCSSDNFVIFFRCASIIMVNSGNFVAKHYATCANLPSVFGYGNGVHV